MNAKPEHAISGYDEDEQHAPTLPSGVVPNLPAGYSMDRAPGDYYHMVCRRIIADTTVRFGRMRRISRMNETTKWLIAVDRWRTTTAALRVDREVSDPDAEKMISRMAGCTPPGYVQHRSFSVRSCHQSSICLFCFARAVADRTSHLIRCFYRRPDPDRPVYLVRFSMPPNPKPGAPVDQIELLNRPSAYDRLKKKGCAGGVSCAVPVGPKRSHVLLGITDRPLKKAVVLDRRTGPAAIADAATRYMAWPWRWSLKKNLVDRVFDRLYDSTVRSFESHGLARLTGVGHGPTALKYAETGTSG